MKKKYLFLIMTISTIISALEKTAPLQLQEDYDNAGLITGAHHQECSGVLICLDVTEEIIDEAIEQNCNLIVAHHPIVFRGLKKFTGNSYVERVLVKAIKNEVSIYACHTNLDNVIDGVNGKIADKLGLTHRSILVPKKDHLEKLIVYAPGTHADAIEKALFNAGAGNIGNYSECSFVSEGIGSFKPGADANPYSGKKGLRSVEIEKKIEVTFPSWLQNQVLLAMKMAHPYEEVAYEISSISNLYQEIGSGLTGELPVAMEEMEFLNKIKEIFNVKVIKHTALLGKKIKKVAVCGGSGSFLTSKAINARADIYITSDIKYHEFFDAEGSIVLADIGHFESEQFTIDLIADVLRQNFPNFALLKTKVNTNPVRYSVS